MYGPPGIGKTSTIKPTRSPAIQCSSLHWNRKPKLSGNTPSSRRHNIRQWWSRQNNNHRQHRHLPSSPRLPVVAVDCDVGLRNLDLLLGLENRVNYTLVEVLNGDCRLDQALVRDKRWSNFELLCILKSRSKLPLGFGGKALVWLVDSVKE
ncbi:Septum site-determining protein minD homolog, chloroplastic [Linum perenne]